MAGDIAAWSNWTCGMKEHHLAELCPDRSTPLLLPKPQQSNEALVWTGAVGGLGHCKQQWAGGTPGDKLHQHGEVQAPTQSPRQGMCSHQ